MAINVPVPVEVTKNVPVVESSLGQVFEWGELNLLKT